MEVQENAPCCIALVCHIQISLEWQISHSGPLGCDRDFLTCKLGTVTILATHVGLWEEQRCLTFEVREDLKGQL